MNKIEITNKKLNFLEEDHNVKYQINNDEIIFEILKDTDILFKDINGYNKIIFKINENCSLNIKYIVKKRNNINYEYYLDKYSLLNTNLFYNTKDINENHYIYLNGEYSKVDFFIRTISTTNEVYNLYTYHNKEYTESNIKLRGANIENGCIHFNVESNVPKDIKQCKLNQDNRIYTFNQNKCIINPILLIENNDIEANHAAFIGKFDDETLFYLMSRGISKKECYHLLVKGFLNYDNDEEILSIIHKYWR